MFMLFTTSTTLTYLTISDTSCHTKRNTNVYHIISKQHVIIIKYHFTLYVPIDTISFEVCRTTLPQKFMLHLQAVSIRYSCSNTNADVVAVNISTRATNPRCTSLQNGPVVDRTVGPKGSECYPQKPTAPISPHAANQTTDRC